MPRHKKGTLVRVKGAHEAEDWDRDDTADVVKNHGWLYIVERYLPNGYLQNEHTVDAYECKSIASGSLVQLFPCEITTKKEKPRD